MQNRTENADGIASLRRRFGALLGAEGVVAEGAPELEFRDPFEGPAACGHRGALVLQPDSTEQVQAVLRLASELGLHLWTSSMGRNYGYGGSAPVLDGAVILNLRRMNRIVEIDARQGHARIEPGVTFRQLHDVLVDQDVPLAMSVPDLGWGSIIGNALEHGYGYSVMGDHSSALCGLEVVLANGELLRTGQGAIPGSPLWSSHRRGFGPSLDDLFKQSNFGVVTEAGLWLAPRPEVIVTGTTMCRDEGDIVPLIDMLRPLIREGILQGIPMIVGTPDPAEDGPGYGSYTMANLRKVLRPGRWNARLGLYGDAAMVATRRAILESRMAAIPGAELELRTYPGDVRRDDVEPRDLISAGIPNQLLLDRLKLLLGESFGHMDFSPVIPFEAQWAQRIDRLVRETSARHGLLGPVGFLLNARSMVSACMLMFDAQDAEKVSLARRAVSDMYDEIAGWGCSPYRAHVSLVDRVAAKSSFNDHVQRRTYTRIKDALDPKGILSPGNHGIWPSARD